MREFLAHHILHPPIGGGGRAELVHSSSGGNLSIPRIEHLRIGKYDYPTVVMNLHGRRQSAKLLLPKGYRPLANQPDLLVDLFHAARKAQYCLSNCRYATCWSSGFSGSGSSVFSAEAGSSPANV